MGVSVIDMIERCARRQPDAIDAGPNTSRGFEAIAETPALAIADTGAVEGYVPLTDGAGVVNDRGETIR